MADIDEFRRWKVDVLRKYCQERGLSVTQYRRKDELVALAFTACCQNLPIVPGKIDEQAEAVRQLADPLQMEDGTVIPNPDSLNESEWLSEGNGMQFWPPCMVMDISDYLIAKNERPLCTRLANDIKEGKLRLICQTEIY